MGFLKCSGAVITADSDRGFKDQTISNYEDKIRFYAEPNKVFRYFASVEVDGVVFMRPADFVRAVTPGQRQPPGKNTLLPQL